MPPCGVGAVSVRNLLAIECRQRVATVRLDFVPDLADGVLAARGGLTQRGEASRATVVVFCIALSRTFFGLHGERATTASERSLRAHQLPGSHMKRVAERA